MLNKMQKTNGLNVACECHMGFYRGSNKYKIIKWHSNFDEFVLNMFIAYDIIQGKEGKSNDVYVCVYVSMDLWWLIIVQGELITSSWNTSDTAFTTLSGTSMACPHVVPRINFYIC